MHRYCIAVSRYPVKNNSDETGKNIIALDGKSGSRAKQISVVVTGKEPVVLVNGNLLLPERICGNHHHYFSRQVAQHVAANGKEEHGKIESVIVNGEGVRFYAEISY